MPLGRTYLALALGGKINEEKNKRVRKEEKLEVTQKRKGRGCCWKVESKHVGGGLAATSHWENQHHHPLGLPRSLTTVPRVCQN